jgi:hypothetical protein
MECHAFNQPGERSAILRGDVGSHLLIETEEKQLAALFHQFLYRPYLPAASISQRPTFFYVTDDPSVIVSKSPTACMSLWPGTLRSEGAHSTNLRELWPGIQSNNEWIAKITLNPRLYNLRNSRLSLSNSCACWRIVRIFFEDGSFTSAWGRTARRKV